MLRSLKISCLGRDAVTEVLLILKKFGTDLFVFFSFVFLSHIFSIFLQMSLLFISDF